MKSSSSNESKKTVFVTRINVQCSKFDGKVRTEKVVTKTAVHTKKMKPRKDDSVIPVDNRDERDKKRTELYRLVCLSLDWGTEVKMVWKYVNKTLLLGKNWLC